MSFCVQPSCDFLWLEKRIFIIETLKPVEGLDKKCDISLKIEASIINF